MNKMILTMVSAVAVISSAGALLVAKDNNQHTPVATQPESQTPSSSESASMHQEAPPVTTNSPSSNNSVSITNNTNSSSTTNSTTSSNQSSNTSSVSITVSSDGTSRQNLSFSRGTNVTLTIQVLGGGSLKFTSSNNLVNTGSIGSGNSNTVRFKADQSFTIQPRNLDGGTIGDPIKISIN